MDPFPIESNVDLSRFMVVLSERACENREWRGEGMTGLGLGLPLMPFLYRSIVLIATASTPCMAFPAFSALAVLYLIYLCSALPCVNSPIPLLLLRSQPHLPLPAFPPLLPSSSSSSAVFSFFCHPDPFSTLQPFMSALVLQSATNLQPGFSSTISPSLSPLPPPF